MIVEHNNFLVGWLIIKSIEDNPILNSHLQLIHNSRFHSSQTQNHSFKFTVTTTVFMESIYLVCANAGIPRQTCAKSR